ncbi:MAG: NYN domain-containing protein [Firmicutes bacterium]|nr:NYN domain-containing protein [Bacillota bacterium]MBQ6662514.1 NYN domain-containing protein [Bacillota bacterium]MCR4712373.1 NYN domain-containing protein [Clostridia bacterium]
MNEEKRIALLIDAENISAQYADDIIDEVSNYGVCSYKRIYGSWDRIVHTKWESEIKKNSLKAMMQINNTRAKNATDSALIIDAMDILYKGNVDVFCIVSSDSDFTSLARRLMESGVMVIGMGESDKATEALENAYDKFVYIDVLAKQADEEEAAARAAEAAEAAAAAAEAKKGKGGQGKQAAGARKAVPAASADRPTGNTPSKRELEERIKQIIMENLDKGKATDLGQIGNELSRIYRNFDVRYYDKKGGGKYKYLREFVADFKSFLVERGWDDRIFVGLKNKQGN